MPRSWYVSAEYDTGLTGNGAADADVGLVALAGAAFAVFRTRLSKPPENRFFSDEARGVLLAVLSLNGKSVGLGGCAVTAAASS